MCISVWRAVDTSVSERQFSIGKKCHVRMVYQCNFILFAREEYFNPFK